MSFCRRRVGFLIAAKSMSRFIVGYFARQLNAIPVVRALDVAKVGSGTIDVSDFRVFGTNTKFTQHFPSSQILIPNEMEPIRIDQVISDTEMILVTKPTLGDRNNVSYKIVPKLDHSDMYKDVWERLNQGTSIGIFPEGGSHDRSDLLPLKAGVSIIALGALDKYPGLLISIVPCGLTYFSGHRFRSHVAIEFGKPYKVPQYLVKKYSSGDKRGAANELLEVIELLLRSVTINADSFSALQVIHMTRRLYLPETSALPLHQYMNLNRNFASGYAQMSARNDEELKILYKNVENYNEYISMLGVKDQHVKAKEGASSTFRFFFLVMIRMILSILAICMAGPGLVLISPIGLIAKVYASQKAKIAKASSIIKIKGTDVIASYKIIIGMVVTPILYLIYCSIIFYYFGLFYTLIFSFSWPILTWASLRVGEEGVFVWKSLVYLLRVRLWSEDLKELRLRRVKLQQMVRDCVKKGKFGTIESYSVMESASKHTYVRQKELVERNGYSINENMADIEKSLMYSNFEDEG